MMMANRGKFIEIDVKMGKRYYVKRDNWYSIAPLQYYVSPFVKRL